MYTLIKLAQNKLAMSMILSLVLGFVLAPSVLAQTSSTTDDFDFGIDKVDQGISGTLGNQDLIDTITSLINVALSLLGIVAVIIVLIGGFKWMTAGGNDDKVTEGRKYITSGVIGLAIILSAWAITRFVIGNLSQATGSGDSESILN